MGWAQAKELWNFRSRVLSLPGAKVRGNESSSYPLAILSDPIPNPSLTLGLERCWYWVRIIIGSDRRPETKQGIEGKIVRFRSGRLRVRDRVIVKDN